MFFDKDFERALDDYELYLEERFEPKEDVEYIDDMYETFKEEGICD